MRIITPAGASDHGNSVLLLTACGPVKILTLAPEVLDCPVQSIHGAETEYLVNNISFKMLFDKNSGLGTNDCRLIYPFKIHFQNK